MPLPLIPLALGAAALYVASRKPPPASQTSTGSGKAIAPADPSIPATNGAQSAGGVLGGIIAAVGTAIGGGIAGKAVDQAVNPNSNEFSQTVAGVAVGTSLGLGTLALTGALGPILTALGCASLVPFVGVIVGIVVGVLVLTYVLVVVVQDLVRLQYGQAGGRRDFAKQFQDIHSHALEMAQANPQRQVSDIQLERELLPFTEGFMSKKNWENYVAVMAKKGVAVPGEHELGGRTQMGIPILASGDATFPGTAIPVTPDLLWHFNWYLDRGYLLGASPTMRQVDPAPEFDALFVPYSNFPLSQSDDFVKAHCPPEEIVATKVGTVPDDVYNIIKANPGISWFDLNYQLAYLKSLHSGGTLANTTSPRGGTDFVDYTAADQNTVAVTTAVGTIASNTRGNPFHG